jgi:ribokinase
LAARAGSDAFGDLIRRTLYASAVELAQLQRDDGPSGMSAAIVDKNGDYGAVIVSAANLNLAADEITIPEGTSVVLLQNEIPQAVNMAVAEKAKAAGARVWLNAAPARALPQGLVQCVDLLIVNRVEAIFYAQTGFALDILTTLGSDGVRYQGRRYPACAVRTRSTHGAGDMFAGALAACYDKGRDMAEAIRFAQAAAALHVASGPEERAALSPDQVVTFLKNQDSR